MAKTKFSKETLQDLVGHRVGYEHPSGCKLISDEVYDTTRWSTLSELIFQSGEKFFQVCYSKGSTEMQDESPFEYEPDEVECNEVIPKEVTKIEYVPVDAA